MLKTLCAMLAICTSTISFVALTHEVALPKTIDDFSLYRISPKVYVVHGIQALPDETNAAFMSNSGIVLTDAGVVIIDSGGSLEVGRRLVAEIRTLSDHPVVAVFNSHLHGDHWLGNEAIHENYPDARFYAHSRAIDRIEAGAGTEWSDIIARMIGQASNAGVPIFPSNALEGGETLTIGGIEFNIHHTGHAHTDGDIMIELPGSRLLFAGDIIEHGRAVSSDVPQDFDIKGQIEAIRFALVLPVDTYVPGHGSTGGPGVARAALRFLETLHASVKVHYESGMMDFEMLGPVTRDLHEYREWFGFGELGRLLSYVYQQVEAEAFE